LQQLEVRGWVHRDATSSNAEVSQLRFRRQLVAMMSFNLEASANVREAYWNWLDEAVLAAVRERRGLYHGVLGDVGFLVKHVLARGQEVGDDI
jgi:hypothetical protein